MVTTKRAGVSGISVLHELEASGLGHERLQAISVRIFEALEEFDALLEEPSLDTSRPLMRVLSVPEASAVVEIALGHPFRVVQIIRIHY